AFIWSVRLRHITRLSLCAVNYTSWPASSHLCPCLHFSCSVRGDHRLCYALGCSDECADGYHGYICKYVDFGGCDGIQLQLFCIWKAANEGRSHILAGGVRLPSPSHHIFAFICRRCTDYQSYFQDTIGELNRHTSALPLLPANLCLLFSTHLPTCSSLSCAECCCDFDDESSIYYIPTTARAVHPEGVYQHTSYTYSSTAIHSHRWSSKLSCYGRTSTGTIVCW
ncbi:hypothetical protein OSTOST_14564, partial [Ostertagia ostertagi]